MTSKPSTSPREAAASFGSLERRLGVVLLIALLAAFPGSLPGQVERFAVDKAKSRIAVGARATNHDFTGVLTAYDLKITGKKGSRTPASVHLKWDFKDLHTGDKKRDRNMLKWLEHAKMPHGEFRLVKWIRDAEGTTFARGTITIHGVRRTITFPCRVTRQGRTLTALGSARLNYKDFGLPQIRQLAVLTVKPELVVTFHLVGTAR